VSPKVDRYPIGLLFACRGREKTDGLDVVDLSSVRSLGSPSQTASGNAGSKTLPTPSKLKLGRGFSARSSTESARVKDMEKAVAGMTIRDKDEKVEVVYLVRLALSGEIIHRDRPRLTGSLCLESGFIDGTSLTPSSYQLGILLLPSARCRNVLC
jgi:hypothetical protein